MATYSYGVLTPTSSLFVKQVDESFGSQYQSNGYNNGSWNQKFVTNWTNSGSVLQGGARQNGYTLQTSNIQRLAGGYAEVTYNWVYQPTVVPPTAYSMQGAVEEMPIQLNPQLVALGLESIGWNKTTGQFDFGSAYYGRTSYKAPVLSVSVTSYSTSQPSLDIGSTPLGKLQSPDGDFGGDYTHWFVDSYNISLQGALWITSAIYLFNGDGYDTTIYQEA